jgi:putative membrane protein
MINKVKNFNGLIFLLFCQAGVLLLSGMAAPRPIEFQFIFLIIFSTILVYCKFSFTNSTKFILITLSAALLAEIIGLHYGLFGSHYEYKMSNWNFDGLAGLPLFVIFFWFTGIAICFFITSDLVKFQQFKSPLVRSGIGGLLMTMWDFFLDPMGIKNELWSWKSSRFWIELNGASVPFENYVSWFLGTTILFWILNSIFNRVENERSVMAPAIVGYVLLLMTCVSW